LYPLTIQDRPTLRRRFASGRRNATSSRLLLCLVCCALASMLTASSLVTPADSAVPPIINCSSVVRGGALSKVVVRGVTCSFAQRIWNHFASDTARGRPPLPAGWRCLSFLMTVQFPLSETDCAGQTWQVWARFTED
jgi:hypothetical protein